MAAYGLESLLADVVLYPAGVLAGGFFIDAQGRQEFRRKLCRCTCGAISIPLPRVIDVLVMVIYPFSRSRFVA